MEYTIEELSKETCNSFGGNNCVLHQYMFGCVLEEAKKKARGETKPPIPPPTSNHR